MKIWLFFFSVLATVALAEDIDRGRRLLQTYTWTQIGSNIVGEAAGDKSGSVSISSDGTRVAIGAYGNGVNYGKGAVGHVRVYAESGGVWTQVGEDIDGEAVGDFSGDKLSMSSDGTRVAIGAEGNDGNGKGAGHVRVYAESGGAWTQVGEDIDGESAGDYSSRSVSMSSDGTRVAIGAVGNDGTGSNAGHVRVYAESGGTWTQVGEDIDGEAAGDMFGTSVSMSSDGARVAIGAPNNDGTGTDAGHVRVYAESDGAWTQIGEAINGEAAGDYSSRSVSMSSDGTRVAIGGLLNDGTGSNAGHARVYEESGGTWTQVGADIDGEAAGDQSGSVSMSSDGARVAIGARRNDGTGTDAGHVRVFQFGIPCNPPAVSMHAGEVVGGLGECDGIEKIPHLSKCTITCNTAEGYYVEGPAMCNQGTLIGGVKCLCTKGHPRPWHGTLACQKRMRGIHVPGTFHDEL